MIFHILLAAALALPVAWAHAAPPSAAAAEAAIREASGGTYKSAKGSYVNPRCGGPLEYQAEAVDLNGDGVLEVFTQEFDPCAAPGKRSKMDLLVRDAKGYWRGQFGFAGGYKVLKTRNKGFADVAIDMGQACSPVWRWNGTAYEVFKGCGQAAKPGLDGHWRARFADTGGQESAADVMVSGGKGTWTVCVPKPSTASGACSGRPRAFEIEASPSQTAVLRILGAGGEGKAEAARVTVVNVNTLEGEFADGRVLRLERQ